MTAVSPVIDRIEVIFDDETLVADAGLIVPATLMLRLDLEASIDQTLRGSHIDHADRCGPGPTHWVLPFQMMAPSTLGTFLQSFTVGHVRHWIG